MCGGIHVLMQTGRILAKEAGIVAAQQLFWLHNHFVTIIYGKRQGESIWGKPNGLTYFYDNDILN